MAVFEDEGGGERGKRGEGWEGEAVDVAVGVDSCCLGAEDLVLVSERLMWLVPGKDGKYGWLTH